MNRFLVSILILTLMSLSLPSSAQKLTVDGMKATNDLSASQYRRKDLSGEACALVKVQLATTDVGFEGNVIQPVEYKGGEYWVYMSKGSRELRIKHLTKSPAFVPCHVSFSDYGIRNLESLTTYDLTLLLPQGASTVQTQKLIFDYTPTNAMVLIDSKPYQGEGHIEVSLPIGKHDYIIAATGYDTVEGSVKLNASSPRSITEKLNASQQKTNFQTTQPINPPTPVEQETETKTEDSEIVGKTIVQIRSLGYDYQNGTEGKAKDYVKAMKYFRIAAEQGDAEAQSNLGMMYELGHGVAQDYSEAIKWYKKSAEQGFPVGQANLGYMYEKGYGVKQDMTTAKYWYKKAASQGGENASGNSLETITVKGVSFNMVRVEGGTFQMGATPEQVSDARDAEKPVHQVTLSTFSIGETEVTQALWEAVTGSNPSKHKGDNLPVEQVSWEDCQKFIARLNHLTNRNFRLPTEAEWEYAARGGNKSRGYKYCGSNNVDDVAWDTSNSSSKTHLVKTKQANELGLYDMGGNVWEWCQDWYDSYSSDAQTNPTGAASGSSRVRRGGSWETSAFFGRVARFFNSPDYRSDDLGLRLVLQ